MGRKKISKNIPEDGLGASDALPVAGAAEMGAILQAARGLSAKDVHGLIGELQKSETNEGKPLKSAFIDPYNLLDFLGSRSKPSRVTWQILRRMSLSCKPVAAIIQTRQNQVAAFTQIPRRTGDIGFRITTKDHRKRLTQSDIERIHELENWFLSMGYEQNDGRFYDGERKRDNFETFIRKMVRDTLSMDAVCFEKQLNRFGKPHAIWPVDPGTIKYASEKYKFDTRTGEIKQEQIEYTNGLPVRYTQELYNGIRVACFNEKELVYGVRNPRTDADIGGYGLSELEILMETVTQILFAEQYNAKYFTQNSLPQGVLNIAGKYTAEALEAFKRQWVAQVSGASNAWRIPIMAIDDSQGGINFVPFKGNNKEMQFNLWLEYLIQTACAVYTIDPSEIGYVIKGSGGGPMVEHSGAVRIDFSKDKGLRPMLKFFAHLFNEHIVREIYPDLFFEWVGIDAMPEKEKIEMTTKKIAAGVMTVNEARLQEGKEPINENWANAPANATLVQVYMADMNYQREREDGAHTASAGISGASPKPGAPPLPGGDKPPSEQPKSPRVPTPEDNGVEMATRTHSKKDTTTSDFQAARENEKNKGAADRERKHLGMNVYKAQGEDGDIEISVE